MVALKYVGKLCNLIFCSRAGFKVVWILNRFQYIEKPDAWQKSNISKDVQSKDFIPMISFWPGMHRVARAALGCPGLPIVARVSQGCLGKVGQGCQGCQSKVGQGCQGWKGWKRLHNSDYRHLTTYFHCMLWASFLLLCILDTDSRSSLAVDLGSNPWATFLCTVN